jgi:hypothetical protein
VAGRGVVEIIPVKTRQQRREFIELAYRLNAGDPNWVPPLKDEVRGLINPAKNPWFGHGIAQLFVARRDERTVGRISAHIDRLALEQPVEQGFGPGTGFWGLFEAEDAKVTAALLDTAATWLRERQMTRMLGPVSLSMWDEPGLLVTGFDHPPSVMMSHNSEAYAGWIEGCGHMGVQDLLNYRLPIADGFPELTNRIVAMGEKSGRITIRRADKSRFAAEAALLLGILNNAWSDNWGFVPLTDAEIAYAGKKLKQIVYEDLVRFAEMDGETVAFMMTVPDLNEKLKGYDGSLFPFNWARLLWWMRAPKVKTMRVPLMGVVKRLQGTRTASQLAFMLIEYIRRDAVTKFGATQGDFGWVLASNEPMKSVGEAVGGTVTKIYRIYEKAV